jgi:stage V sporulation protein B
LKIPVIAACVGALLKIPLNYFLIGHPSVRIIGAVISTIICYAVASGICYYFFVKHVKFKVDMMGVIVKPVMAAGIMGIGCYVFYHVSFIITGSNAASVIAAVVLGMAVYLASLLVLGGVRKGDVRLLPMGRRLSLYLERKGLVD